MYDHRLHGKTRQNKTKNNTNKDQIRVTSPNNVSFFYEMRRINIWHSF